MTEKRFTLSERDLNEINNTNVIADNGIPNTQRQIVKLLNELYDENKELKSTIAQLIEENRKNNELLLSDIRILEKALWCSGCANDYGRLKELRKEFMRGLND